MKLEEFQKLRTGDQVVRTNDDGTQVRGNVRDARTIHSTYYVECIYDDGICLRYWDCDPRSFARLERYTPPKLT